MRVSNIDTLACLLDRLVTERIKWHAFVQREDRPKMAEQEKLVEQIRIRMSDLIQECVAHGEYDHLRENRTYATKGFIEELESLIDNNFNFGDADRTKVAALETLVRHELRARRCNEARAIAKNGIDEHFGALVDRAVSHEAGSPPQRVA